LYVSPGGKWREGKGGGDRILNWIKWEFD
jgi:hypothetical protein